MPCPPLRFVSFLAPNMFPVYDFVVREVGRRLGLATELTVGTSYDDLIVHGHAGFLCGLAYVKLHRDDPTALRPLAAPVLEDARAGGQPVYFSDVIVHRDSPLHAFADLRGRSWAYNEPDSQSGYGVVRYSLLRLGESEGFFGRVVQAGWHERSIQMVCTGEVDCSAIDCQVLAVALRSRPELRQHLRVIHTLGPSTIQPLVAGRNLPATLDNEIRAAVCELADDPLAGPYLRQGFVERFVPVTENDYDDIRAMLAAVEGAEQSSPLVATSGLTTTSATSLPA